MENMNTKSLLTTAGISLLVSSAVVMANNYFFYKYIKCTCNNTKEQSKEQSKQ